MGNSLWYLWQLPQNLLGLALSKYLHYTGRVTLTVTPTGRTSHNAYTPRMADQMPLSPQVAEEISAHARNLKGAAKAVTDWKIILVQTSGKMGAISLGRYLIINQNNPSRLLIAHERGHQVQSRRLGPLYLVVVGIPSITRVWWQNTRQANWPAAKRLRWYYSGWPESAANKHSGVTSPEWPQQHN